MTKIRERCSCGAELELTDATLQEQQEQFDRWRMTHACTTVSRRPTAGTASAGLPAGAETR